MRSLSNLWIGGLIRMANIASALAARALVRGNAARAEKLYAFALRLFRGLGREITNPDRTVGSALLLLSEALADQGKLLKAQGALQECLSIRRRLFLVSSNSSAAKDDLAAALERMGSLAFHRLGDVVGARALYEESLQLRTQIAESDPTSEQGRLALAVTRGQLGAILTDQRAFEEALPLLQQSLDAFSDLSVDNPTSETFEIHIAGGLTRLGVLHLDEGDVDSAREAFENSNYIRQGLVTKHPSSRDRQIDVGISLGWLGVALAKQRNDFGARARLQEAIDLFSRLSKKTPASTLVGRNLWMWMWNMALFIPAGPIKWTDVARQMEALQRDGALPPTDVHFLDEARLLASGKLLKGVGKATLDLIPPPAVEQVVARKHQT